MQLSTQDLYLLSQCAISAALQAGQVIANFDRKNLIVNSKQAGKSRASQVVTEVDHLSQAVILQNLLPSCAIYDLALLTEESPDDGNRLQKDYFWCIDPLDGTLPFIEGVSGYSVVIALVSKTSVPMIGVIYDPIKKTLYYAIKGAGVFKNGKPWQVTQITDNAPLTFIFDRSFSKHPHYQTVVADIKIIAKNLNYNGVKFSQHGGGAMNACWVLENAPACYFKFPSQHLGGGALWDFSASACLFNEMEQAVVSDIHGQALDLNRADSTFMNHRGILYSSDKKLATLIKALYQKLR